MGEDSNRRTQMEVSKTAKRLGVTRQTVYNMIKDGRLEVTHDICPTCGADRTALKEMMDDGDSACRQHGKISY